MFNGKEFGEQIVAAVREALGAAITPLRERLAVVEARKDVEGVEGAVSDIRERLARLEERKPEKGDRGDNGLGFDDMSVEHDGERAFLLTFTRGDEVKAFPFILPVVLDRGVYKAETTYERGDGVSFGGSFWIAKTATSAKPGEGEDWRLAVKRGRDGKDKA